jgi:hypothetical protein
MLIFSSRKYQLKEQSLSLSAIPGGVTTPPKPRAGEELTSLW